MTGFTTVGDIVTQVRRNVQDVAADRYDDTTVYQSLNMALLESRRIRPDMYRATPDTIPQYNPTNVADPIDFELQYRNALIMYVAGMLQLEDEEGNEDGRAAGLLKTFTIMLTGPVGAT